ncbi:MAG: GIY-YIG nuclease family protein [Patescibacteria group bacterium]
MYYVYILECTDKTLYCGITTDLKRRLVEHKAGKGGNYTRSHGAVKMLYTEKKKDRSSASKREAMIKKMSRSNKLSLIKKGKATR